MLTEIIRVKTERTNRHRGNSLSAAESPIRTCFSVSAVWLLVFELNYIIYSKIQKLKFQLIYKKFHENFSFSQTSACGEDCLLISLLLIGLISGMNKIVRPGFVKTS